MREWVYTIKHHGAVFIVRRSKEPFADGVPISVGTWSPTFKCGECKKFDIRAQKIKRGYPHPGRTTFKVHCHGVDFYEMFFDDKLEKEKPSNLKLEARDDGVKPFDPPPLNPPPLFSPPIKVTFPSFGAAHPVDMKPSIAPSKDDLIPIQKPGKRRVRFAEEEQL